MSIQDGSLTTVRRDLELAIDWHDLRELTLPGTKWTVIIGHKRRSDPLRVVVPLPLHSTSLTAPELKSIFTSISSLSPSDIPEPLERLAPTVAELQIKRAALAKAESSSQTGQAEDVEARASEKTEQERQDENDEHEGEDEFNESLDRDMIYMAIVTTDATVVYYRLSKGLKKPTDIPDE